MIFHKILKYKILDYCLDILFKSFSKNFQIFNNRINVNNLVIGMILSEIKIKAGSKIYKKCKIVEIINLDYDNYGIQFSWVSVDFPSDFTPNPIAIAISSSNPDLEFYL